jgi:TonB family protein
MNAAQNQFVRRYAIPFLVTLLLHALIFASASVLLATKKGSQFSDTDSSGNNNRSVLLITNISFATTPLQRNSSASRSESVSEKPIVPKNRKTETEAAQKITANDKSKDNEGGSSSGSDGTIQKGSGMQTSNVADKGTGDSNRITGSGSGGDRSMPVPKEKIRPRYPQIARKEGREGTVRIRAIVDSRGVVTETSVADSSGSYILDKAGLDAVSGAQFFPAMKGEVPVDGTLIISVVFRLDDTPEK